MRLRIASIGVMVGVLALTAVGIASGAPSHHRPSQPPPPPTTPAAVFTVDGHVTTPLSLTVDDLRKLPWHTERVTFNTMSGPQTHWERGPLLIDVLDLAGPVFDPAVKNDKLRDFVAVTGSDGYEAIVAWGEIDPSFANQEILLSVREDGASLAATGPRLVVPGDGAGGRYVSGVASIRLGSADDAP